MRFKVFTVALALVLTAGIAGAERIERGLFHISYQSEDADLARRSADVLESALQEFNARLPAGEAPIRVVIAGSINEFLSYAKGFSQVSVTGVARPSEGLIVVKSPKLTKVSADYRGTLRHELIHVLLARNVNTVYLPKWLNEGLCMMLANEYRWASPIQVARMFVTSRIIDYDRLDYAFLAPGSEMEFGDAYAQALSMTRHLRDTLGEAAFWRVVLATREMRFPKALEQHGGMTPGDFWGDYRSALWGIAMIGTLSSGSIFLPASLLAIYAFFRRKMRDRSIRQGWAEEEEQGDDLIVSLDELAEGPYDWEVEQEDD